MNSLALGIDFGLPLAPIMYGLWLRPTREGRLDVVDVPFRESRDDLGETRPFGFNVVARAADNASRPFSPWANYPRRDSIHLWRGWREEGDLVTLPYAGQDPQRLEIGAAAVTVHPTLTVESGELDVFFMPSPAKLALARFMPDAGSPRVLGPWPIMAPVVGATALLTPVALGSRRRVLTLSQQETVAIVQLRDFGSGDEGPLLWEAQLDGLYVVPGSRPAMTIDADGSTRVFFLVSKELGSPSMSVATVTFPARPGGAPMLAFEACAPLPMPAIASAVVTQSLDVPRPRVDFIALLPDGSVFHSGTDEEPMRPDGIPAVPLEAVARRNCTYYGCANPARGMFLETLR